MASTKKRCSKTRVVRLRSEQQGGLSPGNSSGFHRIAHKPLAKPKDENYSLEESTRELSWNARLQGERLLAASEGASGKVHGKVWSPTIVSASESAPPVSDPIFRR